MKHSSRKTYADRFLQFSAPVEKWLKRLAVLLLVAVVLCQGLLLWNGFRQAVTEVDRAEGLRIGETAR